MACPQVLAQPCHHSAATTGGHKIKQTCHPPKIVSDTEGWPKCLGSAAVWDGTTLNGGQYTYQLNKDEINEVEAALAHFKALGLHPRDMNEENFPLPTLCEPLTALAREVRDGRGFFSVRGLKPEKYSDEGNTLLFLGLSHYVGDKRAIQNEKGHIFAHIRDAKATKISQDARPVRNSNRASPFHTDLFGGILAIQTRSNAFQGGKHMLASVANVYNELVNTRPDLIPVLAAPNWSFDTRSVLIPSWKRSILFYHKGRTMMSFARDPLIGIDKFPRPQHLPETTAIQIEALDTIQAIATKHQCILDMQPGDITFVNNLSILHAREAFEDSDSQSRYLVRMWLKNTGLEWDMPREFLEKNKRLFENKYVKEDWNVLYQDRVNFEDSEIMPP